MFTYLIMLISTPEGRSKFETIYRHYGGLMYHIAYQILNHQQDSEDAVQQAFIKIAQNIDNISEAICPKTQSYIVTIVESKAIDIYRANKRRNTVEYDDNNVGLSIPGPQISSLATCIQKLPPRYREVIILKYYHGLSSKEIASQLDISLANAIKLDQRVKHKLSKLCKEEGIL